MYVVGTQIIILLTTTLFKPSLATYSAETLTKEVEALKETDVKLTCKFKADDKVIVVWRNEHGAKIKNDIDGFSIENVGSADLSSTLTIPSKMVTKTTTYRCELEYAQSAQVDPPPLPPTVKMEVRVYTITAHDQVTIKRDPITIKCAFGFIMTKPSKIFFQVGQEEITKTKPNEYELNPEGSGFADYSTDSKSLITILKVSKGQILEDQKITCGVDDKKLEIDIDVFTVSTTYVEMKSRERVQITCSFEGVKKPGALNVFWSRGQGGKHFNKESAPEEGYTITDTPSQTPRKSVLTIPPEKNEYTSDYFCSVLDVDYYREARVKVGVFHIEPVSQTYQQGIAVTLTCKVSSLRYPINVEWFDGTNSKIQSSNLSGYTTVDDDYDPKTESQNPKLIVKAEKNIGTATFTCKITPNITDTKDGDVVIDPKPGSAKVTLEELINSGSRCSLTSIRELRLAGRKDNNDENKPIPCFDILRKGTKYPAYETEQYIPPGNNIEIKPLNIFAAAFAPNFVYRCTSSGAWDRNPLSCAFSQLQAHLPSGSCSTKGKFHPAKYKIKSGADLEAFNAEYLPDYTDNPNPDIFYSYVPEGTKIEYSIRNTDCYVFDSTQPKESYETTCTGGSFEPPIVEIKKMCCKHPTFTYVQNPSFASFCVGVQASTASDLGFDELTKEHYVTDGATITFDKKCPCYSLDLNNITCHAGVYATNFWELNHTYPNFTGDTMTVSGKVQMKLKGDFNLKKYCCKIPKVLQTTGHPESNYSTVQYVTTQTTVGYFCTGYCYRIKTAPATCIPTENPTLATPICVPDPNCCHPQNYTNPFVKHSSRMLWNAMANNGRQHYPDKNDHKATRKCLLQKWDLVEFSKPNEMILDNDLLNATLTDIKSKNCSVMINLMALNITQPNYNKVIEQFYNHSFSLTNANVTTKEEKELCYLTLRYIHWDYIGTNFLDSLSRFQKNKVIIATAKVITEWAKQFSDSVAQKFTYASYRIRTKAKALSKTNIFFGKSWMIDVQANEYADSSFAYAITRRLFPNTTRSNIVSPVVWVDLPQNSTIPGKDQYVVIRFESAYPLNSQRHYTCGVYNIGAWKSGDLTHDNIDLDNINWVRGACGNVSVSWEDRAVTCTCTDWRMFVGVTETFNNTDHTLAGFIVGNSKSRTFMNVENVLHASVIAPIVLAFVMLCKADTRKKPLIHCRLQICIALVGCHLLSLLSFWMEPANISCVYIMYIYEIFAIYTMVSFITEFVCLFKYIKSSTNKDQIPGKMFCFKFVPGSILFAFIVPTSFIAAYKALNDAAGPKLFVEPFDSQECWFNSELEFYQYFTVIFFLAVVDLAGFLALIVFSFLFKAPRTDVVASGIVYGVVAAKALLQYFRGTEEVLITVTVFDAIECFVVLVAYVGLSVDVKKSLFPGMYATDTEEKSKLVGN